MTARAIVSGALHKAPEAKTAKSGSTYAALTLREKTGQATRWWKVFVFSDALREEVLRLSDGDPLSVAGEFSADVWAPEGREPRVNLSLTADGVLSARRPKAKPKLELDRQRQADNGRERAAHSWAAPSPGGATRAFDDSVAFAPERR